MASPGAANGSVSLPLRRGEVEETTKPLMRARMLPAAAFNDPGVLDWELERIFDGWICAGHVSALGARASSPVS